MLFVLGVCFGFDLLLFLLCRYGVFCVVVVLVLLFVVAHVDLLLFSVVVFVMCLVAVLFAV